MNEREDRLSELMGASLGGDLSGAEAEELDQLLAGDPAVADELARLEQVRDALWAETLTWDERQPGDELRDRVHAATTDPVAAPARRSVATRLLAAAALLAVGGAGGWAASSAQQGPPTGPPGTLGAYEALEFSDRPSDVAVDASLVAHTWGTETVLDVTGLPAGEVYTVVLLDEAGASIEAGSFTAVAGAVTCRMTAATLREDVVSVAVLDDTGGTVMGTDVAAVQAARVVG